MHSKTFADSTQTSNPYSVFLSKPFVRFASKSATSQAPPVDQPLTRSPQSRSTNRPESTPPPCKPATAPYLAKNTSHKFCSAHRTAPYGRQTVLSPSASECCPREASIKTHPHESGCPCSNPPVRLISSAHPSSASHASQTDRSRVRDRPSRNHRSIPFPKNNKSHSARGCSAAARPCQAQPASHSAPESPMPPPAAPKVSTHPRKPPQSPPSSQKIRVAY